MATVSPRPPPGPSPRSHPGRSALRGTDPPMDEAARICASLLSAGAVRRQEIPDLDHPEIRADVERRLSQCGLSLATSAYSDHVGLRLSPAVSDATVLDAASNRGLGADACSLLTVLWARLALQRRTAEDSRTTPGLQPALLPA